MQLNKIKHLYQTTTSRATNQPINQPKQTQPTNPIKLTQINPKQNKPKQTQTNPKQNKPKPTQTNQPKEHANQKHAKTYINNETSYHILLYLPATSKWCVFLGFMYKTKASNKHPNRMLRYVYIWLRVKKPGIFGEHPA